MLITIIAFLVVLSVLILIHELGHFLAARAFGVKAEEFGYGLPPRAVGMVKKNGKWKRVGAKDRASYANTIWSLNWLPIGGFVRIKGEQGDLPADADSFTAKPVWKRFIIIAAGVVMNWVLAVVLFFVALSVGAPTIIEDIPADAIVRNQAVTIVDTLPGGVAERAGIQAMDTIVAVDGVPPKAVEDVQNAIASHGYGPVTFLLKRDGAEVGVTARPEYMEAIKKNGIGVSLAMVGNVSFPLHLAAVHSVTLTWQYTKATAAGFGELIAELFRGGGEAVNSVSGPVGIAVLTGKFAAQGALALLQFAAILSINLAILNFLPIPALDGGRAIFLIYEAIFRKPINRRAEAIAHNIAFMILIALVLLITVRDVWRLVG